MVNGTVYSFGLSEDGKRQPVIGFLPKQELEKLKTNLPTSNPISTNGITIKSCSLSTDHDPYTYFALLSDGKSEVGVKFYEKEEYDYFLQNIATLLPRLK